MAKNVARLRVLVFGAAFAAFSGAVAFGWLYGADLWVLGTAQEHSSGLMDAATSVFIADLIYLGPHWASDVVGGALWGVAAVLWSFGKEDREWRSR